jgi:hypothetical protein
MTQDTSHLLPAGTEVRTIYGQQATLVTEWCVWEASVTVRTASGYTERYHPTKVYRDGKPLDYRP